ncbi:Aldehyde:ferredoxin oxidoreductase [Archaeoglobus sulfaticallidus PM70-1]|uniref:Aldehyde:ferredoxin oxidoreductase n=1 Tax=Archaeoglobus sulfaticallidus PM70-1 TaxID=387631 RepID=N0BJ66_9EURY|nr:aldehyde ferredoxin oxidoreductase N-terminal domain-containing protein [Archaeoglobus sulfaticallidus]AGK60215.1 Aldehyde:ferredoxin oxidoreductase [Archaeoglobus sulfaticallidus PM70-1]
MSFTGKALEINLSDMKYEEIEIDDHVYEKHAGIIGIAYEFAEKLAGRYDPLSPENFVILSAGILTNTGIPGATKTIAVTKNPLNNTYGPAVGGGAFARNMKRAGYDMVILKGKAKHPVWIDINSKIEINKANFWGKDIVETTKLLNSNSVLAIGKAGENRVPIALALIDAIHHIGKGGLGAVLGSKNVKAIRVRGSKDAKIAKPDEFSRVVREFKNKVKSDKVTKIYSDIGIMSAWDAWAKLGYLTRRMKSEVVDADTLKEFGVEKYKERIKKRSTGCVGCPARCKSVLEVEVDGKKVESLASLYLGVAYEFGVKCGVESAEKAVLCHDLANRMGIDAMTFAELFDILATLKESGKTDIDIERSAECVMKYLKLVANREGIGEYIGKGIKGLKGLCEFEDYFIKGIEPIFDPRISFGSEAFGLLTNPRGAQEGPVTITVIPGRKKESIIRYMRSIGASDELIEATFRNGFNSALYTISAENWLWLLNGMGLCRRESIARSLNIDTVRDMFNYATGFNLSNEEMIKASAEAFGVARKLNCSEGYTYKDDLPPKKFFTPLQTWVGKKVWRDYLTNETVDYDHVMKMLGDYYSMRGWKNGCP